VTTLTRVVKRECPRTMDRGRAIILELRPGDIISLRRKGTRTAYSTTIQAVYMLAARQYAAELRRIKAEARKARRAAGTHQP